MLGRVLNPGHLRGRQLCLPHNHGVNHNEEVIKYLCIYPSELLSFFGNSAEFLLSFEGQYLCYSAELCTRDQLYILHFTPI